MPIKIDPDSFYSVDETAVILGKCVETIRRYCRSKRIKAAFKGKKYIIPGRAIIDFLLVDDREQKFAEEMIRRQDLGKELR